MSNPDQNNSVAGGVHWAGFADGKIKARPLGPAAEATAAILALAPGGDMAQNEATLKRFTKTMAVGAHRAAMFWAIESGREDLAQWLDQQGCDVNLEVVDLEMQLVDIALRNLGENTLEICSRRLPANREGIFAAKTLQQLLSRMVALANKDSSDGAGFATRATGVIGWLSSRCDEGNGRWARVGIAQSCLGLVRMSGQDYVHHSVAPLIDAVMGAKLSRKEWAEIWRRSLMALASVRDGVSSDGSLKQFRASRGRISEGLTHISKALQQKTAMAAWIEVNEDLASRHPKFREIGAELIGAEVGRGDLNMRVSRLSDSWGKCKRLGFGVECALARLGGFTRGSRLDGAERVDALWKEGWNDYLDVVLRSCPQLVAMLVSDAETCAQIRQRIEAHPDRLTALLEQAKPFDAAVVLKACGFFGSWQDRYGNTVAHHIAAVIGGPRPHSLSQGQHGLLDIAATADLGLRNSAGETFESIIKVDGVQLGTVIAEIEARVFPRVTADTTMRTRL